MASLSDIFILNPKNYADDNTLAGFIPMNLVDDGYSGSHSLESKQWGEIRTGYSHFSNGDIGIAKISPCFENRKSVIFNNLPNGIGSGTTELTVLRSIGVYSRFYLLLFKSDWYISQGTKEFKGVVGQQRVNKFIFTDLLVPVPPLEEQERIVSKVEKWFALIALLDESEQSIDFTIKILKSKVLYLAIHGRLVPQDPMDEPASELMKRINPKAMISCDNPHYTKLPQGWCLSKIGLVAKYTNGRAFKPEEWESDGLPIIRIQNLNDTEAKYNYSSSRYEAKYLVQSGDLLFAWAASLGAFIWEGPEAWLNQHIFKVEPYEMITKEYLFYFFLSMIDSFYNNSHGSGMVHITKNVFEDIDIPIPPITEQKRIVTTIETLFRQLQMLRESLQA